MSDDGGRGVVGQSLLPLMVGIAPALRVDDLADVVAGDAHGLPVDALCMCDPIIAVDIMGVEVALFEYKGALPYSGATGVSRCA